MKVTDIIKRVRSLLKDTASNPRWTDDTLLACYNEAQLAVVQNRPDTFAKVEDFTCEARARQTLPNGTYRLMDIVDNVTTGRAVTRTDRRTLDAMVTSWASVTGTEVEQYIYDEKSPKVFYVYPVPAAGHTLSILLADIPTNVDITDFDADTTVMELDTIWLNPVLNYMMYRAYMIDGETQGNLMQAQSYLKMFVNDLQLKWNTDLIFSQPQGVATNG